MIEPPFPFTGLPNLDAPNLLISAPLPATLSLWPEGEMPGDTVRVSASDKTGDIILNVSAEGVPVMAAASLLAEFVATLKAAKVLAGLSDIPASLASLPVPAGAPQALPGAPQALPAATGGVTAPLGPESSVQFIPADQLLFLKRADTESGIPRVKIFTKKFQKIGILVWETQDNEAVKRPLDAVGIVVAALIPGQQYAIPEKVRGIQVRFKQPDSGGRPTPDRVLEFLT